MYVPTPKFTCTQAALEEAAWLFKTTGINHSLIAFSKTVIKVLPTAQAVESNCLILETIKTTSN